MALGIARAAVLAFDVGGTDMKSGLVAADGTVLGLRRSPTPRDPQRPAEAILDSIAGLAGEYCDAFPEHHIEAMGLIVPGLVDAEAGIGIYSANLGWRDFPFGQEAEARLGVPVAFGHDVGTAGYAELEFGGAKDHRDVVILVVGTGIAAAVFAAGEPVTAGIVKLTELGA